LTANVDQDPTAPFGDTHRIPKGLKPIGLSA
jgi:hypothetical protein